MPENFWQAKIWGLLHDPALKALYGNAGRGGEGDWQELEVMASWLNALKKDQEENSTDQDKISPKKSGKTIFKWIADSDLITSASDRSAIGSINSSIDYGENGLEIRHLLSGAKIPAWKLPESEHQALIQAAKRTEHIRAKEQQLFPNWLKQETDPKKVFWWLWRCLPKAACQAFDDPSLLLMPAETRIPDGSIWSHTSMTAALCGALAGYDLTEEDITERWSKDKPLSRAYLATFSFTPVQELIKASRKMRDFWAGSWILHYLSAKVCWDLAQIYGPDSFLYPSLFQQPLIDYWLREEWPEFEDLIDRPTGQQLLTAGFPNVLVMILPKAKVAGAMQTANQSLKAEWRRLGREVLNLLQSERHWMPGLQETDSAWNGWLDAHWQTYWAAVAIGKEDNELKDTGILRNRESDCDPWVDAQNTAYNLTEEKRLFQKEELDFLRATFTPKKPGVNIGSWWPYVFDQTRFALSSVKNTRTWQLPTAFGPRSTISGIGPVVHPDNHADQRDWLTEGHTANLWDNHAGLFDGIEELNATEVVKRGLHRILKVLLPHFPEQWREASHSPDLTSGVAGWLRQQEEKAKQGDQEAQERIDYFLDACHDLSCSFPWTTQGDDAPANLPWGIPWVRKHHEDWPNPRLLNAGWLIDDYELSGNLSREDQIKARNSELQRLKEHISTKFSAGNNPTDWYVLAAGDGDSMSEWLKGSLLMSYDDYIPDGLKQKVAQSRQEAGGVAETFVKFLTQKKRMGPATHAALSRALLDFSNQLVPYLTEQRYAGRLIYGGGDDVLAYTNLWEWDSWLWDVRQCFKGSQDPHNEFDDTGDYWRWKQEEKGEPPENVSPRPLFTMGSKASISFGIVIAHHSVPLAIALENLWAAEEEAKDHVYVDLQETNPKKRKKKKDAVQVRVLYGNGNILRATSKFEVFNQWRKLIDFQQHHPEIDPALFEQAAEVWSQHPVPMPEAIPTWTQAFCTRRDALSNDPELREQFRQHLDNLLRDLWLTAQHDADERKMAGERDRQIQAWLKLAAFVLRKRNITIKSPHQED
ncbi:type III-B CRISPR-associated protein Cas10/Cmr2 [Leptodesmis sp.]|uniref:type III-B CRISPR-associated protein Cas10/Cmr2 n=1 Tax=Leptodesmis sp. TaxID=3100501 RepID=UPI0040534A36